MSDARIAREQGTDAARALRRAMERTVDVVGETAAAEGVDCDFAKGGSVTLARNEAQLARAAATADDAGVLDRHGPAPAVGRRGVRHGRRRRRGLGGLYSPHCAAIQPAKLVRGLAHAVERLRRRPLRGHGRAGHRTVVGAHAARPRPGRGRGAGDGGLHGRASGPQAVGGAGVLADARHLNVAGSTWTRIGLARRETFTDLRHLIIYGQRTAYDRIAFGGRVHRLRLHRPRPAYDRDRFVHRALHETLVELFPGLAGIAVTHTWGGPLGINRDWFPSVGFDRARGMAWAGAMWGHGVATANLAGRTLADLILGRDGARDPALGRPPLPAMGARATALGRV